MITIIKNNILRIFEMKLNVMIYIILTLCSVLVALYMSDAQQNIGNIAVLSQDKASIPDSDQMHITYVTNEVPLSQLVMQKYDAYVSLDKEGKVNVETIKGENFQKQVETALQHHVQDVDKETEGKGSRIIGYLIMFVMMQSVAYMSLFGEDKETHMMERIMISSVSFSTYFMAQVIFVILFTFLPAFLSIAILSFIGFNIGFSLLEYVGLLILLSLFSTVITLFMNSIIKVRDTANMACSAIIVLSSIISGSFTSIQTNSSIFNTITSCLPQKAYLHFTQALELQRFTQGDWMEFAYLLCFIIVIFIGSIIAMKRMQKR